MAASDDDPSESTPEPTSTAGEFVPSRTPVTPPTPVTPVATSRKRQAEEWALVLVAEGFAPQLRRGEAGWWIEVELGRQQEAEEILHSWRAERAARATRATLPEAYATTTWELALAYSLALSMLAFHLGLEAANRHSLFVDLGDSQAVLVLAGQAWRTVTALTLHADLSHVAGNTLFGGFFLAALAGRLGIGCSLLAFLVSGALGNLANAVYYGSGHSSVGASTGVFGLVGVLAGLAAWRRHQTMPLSRGAWVPFAAGLAVVAMLGGPGPKVDFSAHVFGLIAGALTGIAIAYPLAARSRPGPAAQWISFALCITLVFGAWRLA